MRITLHLGSHRCGVGSVLALARARRDALRRNGLTVWGPDALRDGRLTGLSSAMVDTGRLRGRIGLRGLDLDGRRLAIVAPELLGPSLTQLERTCLAPDAPARLDRLAAVLGKWCDRIVLAIRDWRSYWTSNILHCAAMGRPLPSPQMLERLVTQPRSWARLATEIRERFPGVELIVLPFERMAGRPDRVLALIGHELDLPLGRAERPHVGIGPRGPALAQLTGKHGAWRPFPPDHEEILYRRYLSDIRSFRAGADEDISEYSPLRHALRDGPRLRDALSVAQGSCARGADHGQGEMA